MITVDKLYFIYLIFFFYTPLLSCCRQFVFVQISQVHLSSSVTDQSGDNKCLIKRNSLQNVLDVCWCEVTTWVQLNNFNSFIYLRLSCNVGFKILFYLFKKKCVTRASKYKERSWSLDSQWLLQNELLLSNRMHSWWHYWLIERLRPISVYCSRKFAVSVSSCYTSGTLMYTIGTFSNDWFILIVDNLATFFFKVDNFIK